MAAGLRSAGFVASELPLADGGEGTLDVLLAARNGRRHRTRVTGPLGDPVDADWGLLPDGTAVIEMARASGLALVETQRPAARRHARHGRVAARGASRSARPARSSASAARPPPTAASARSRRSASSSRCPIVVACDVETRYVDAAAVFGPQKGATQDDIATLTLRLVALDERLGVGDLAGGGAAGGLAGGLASLGATLRSGFDVVAEAVGLHRAAHASRSGGHRRRQARRVEPRRKSRRGRVVQCSLCQSRDRRTRRRHPGSRHPGVVAH